MRTGRLSLYGILVMLVALSSCRGSKYSQYTEGEYTVLQVQPAEPTDLRAFAALEEARNSNGMASRGMLDNYGTTAAGLIFTGIKTLVKKEKEKYHEEYEFIIEPNGHHMVNDSFYFYKGTSALPFDPTDMQFNGFTLLRVCGTDTAMKAVFEVDKTNLVEIFYDGVFRLKLKELQFNYARAKVYEKGDHKLNLDFDIEFFSSFITKEGQLHKDVSIGNFSLNLIGVTLHNIDSCRRFEGTRLSGYSFLVPRSFGYSVQARKAIYNQGAFSIHVNVKETAKPRIVNKFITENSDKIFESASMNMNK
jgi:hypothetical protein